MNTMKSLARLAGAALCAPLLLTACGGGGNDTPPGVVVDRFELLAEGQSLSFALPKATYTIAVSSSPNGVKVSWVNGAGCASSSELTVYSATCSLLGDGQVTVLNPTVLGLGSSESVTIKVTRL
jgi:hypothetical protein